MKKILIIAAVLALAIGLMVPATGWAFTYNTTDDVVVTLQIPSIKVLDMGAADNDVTFVEATAADLDVGFVVKNAATSFVVDSNNETWSVTVQAGSDLIDGANTIAITNLKLKSEEGDSVNGGGLTVLSVWTSVESDNTINAVVGSTHVSDCQVIVHYKLLIDWDTEPDDGSGYQATLTYTLT